jgi:hypothetical protein
LKRIKINELCDRVGELDIINEKIMLISQNVNDYFSIRDEDVYNKCFIILHDYKRCSIYTDILLEYISTLQNAINELNLKLNALS